MSLNSLTETNYIHSVKAFRKLFSKMIYQVKAARTIEEKLGREWEIVNTFEELISFDKMVLPEVKVTDHLEVNRFNYPRRMFNYILIMNNIRVESISETYLSYLNNQKSDLLEIYGKVKRIKQKKATLDLWSGGKAKFILSEHFLNLDNLSTKYTNTPMCSIDTVAGCLTLPITGSRTITPSKVSLGSGSNGYAGSAEINAFTDNQRPEYIFDGNQETWFQYEGNTGPLSLVLVCELSKTEIINQIDIEPVNIGTSINYSVKNITFSSSNKENATLKAMVSGQVSDDYFTVNSSENDSYWSCKFLPVRCQQVIIHLEQSDKHQVKAYNPEGREISARKLSIGVRSIALKQNEYASLGGINSSDTSIQQGLYAANVTTQIFPKRDLLYNIYSDVSFDSGETWEMDVYSLPEEESKTMVLDGSAESVVWRARLERNDEAFPDARSLTDEEVEFDIESKQRVASRFISPVKMALEERPFNKEVYVIQPKVGRRTSRRKKSIRLGKGTSGAITRFPLGFSLEEMGLEADELHVYVNGTEWTRVDDSGPDELNPSAGLGEFHLNRAENALVFGGDLPDRTIVTFRFDEERVLWEEASDGYYAALSAPFDPDPMNIHISGRPVNGKKISKIIPRGKRKVYLGVKDILYENGGDQIEFSSDSGYSFRSEASIYAVNTSVPGVSDIHYYLDGENGILHLNPAIDDSHNVKITFQHLAPELTDRNKIKVITDGIKPTGIRVDKDSLQLTDYQDASRSQRDKRFNPKTRTYGQRVISINDPTSGNKATILTHDYIVKGTVIVDSSLLEGYSAKDFPMVETEYIDGTTEFLGLLQMDNEKTISIFADSSGIVNFRLAAGASVYRPFGVSFDDASVFDTAQEQTSLAALETLGPSAVGAYYIDYSNGFVYVTVGVGGELPADINISYSYRDLNFNSDNLYSVDYRGGILYTAKSQKSSKSKNIKYKTSQHTIGYDLAKEIDLYRYNVSKNVVLVRTEGMSILNNLIKVVWAKAKVKPDLAELRKYFSPIINTFGIRFQ